MQCHPSPTLSAPFKADPPPATIQPLHGLAPMERLMDLLQEVRHVSRQLQRKARQLARCDDEPAYAEVLHAMLSDRMRSGDARMRIVCYASAAELGVPVELPAEHCRQAMAGGPGFALRVLFWAAHRRMQGARRPRRQAGE
ncbi:hypothetical protein CTP10_R49240 [Cupriavidus sp. P-10]|uniref:hypothetical protein n=1 Tax=Cupriavidus sp. P-10 TaxID=2027911 RepID=UPI000ECEB2AA|nr:hypothetical protein [Cupriavidus sp. P-10]BDB27516.1 hypothetical protein CTP10_R49240 [Cupriavidus sp. P-10]